jgi:hypothetical protein
MPVIDVDSMEVVLVAVSLMLPVTETNTEINEFAAGVNDAEVHVPLV